ncbi:MAG: tetratricopeptide repeat protein [Gammaproteobacteria bacterium]|nr:tetratricopeptide repeat protein [Gammaproteobacteria bacterium]
MRNKPRSFLGGISAEMLRRRVYPVIIAYALISWALLQIGEVTFEPLGLPGWVMTLLVVVVIAGFPLAAILAWMFDITPSGIRRDARPIIADTTIDDPASIAVLPFTDMSRQQDQGYFCEGIAEAILHALTKIESLRVAARMSSFRYANADADLQDIGRKLGVNTILEGSVRKSGDQLRITAQLVNVKDGYHLWSESYDRKLEDVFAVQDEIATSIAGLLLNSITPIATSLTRDILAYDYYLRGRQFLSRFRKVDFESARQMFHQAIEKDPKFAQAWASYADSFSLEVMYAYPALSLKEKAHEASERALALNPDIAETQASAGLAHLVNEDFDRAEFHLNKAIELNPGLWEAYYYFARCRFHQGDMASASELFEKAASVNPEDYQSRALRVLVLRGEGRLDEAKLEARRAIAVVEKHLEWNPDDVRALLLGASSLIVLDEIERAGRWMRRAMEIDPDDPISLYNIGCNLAMLNKVEKALDYLERAFDGGTISKDWMEHDADLVNLHSHPRYAALFERVAA